MCSVFGAVQGLVIEVLSLACCVFVHTWLFEGGDRCFVCVCLYDVSEFAASFSCDLIFVFIQVSFFSFFRFSVFSPSLPSALPLG